MKNIRNLLLLILAMTLTACSTRIMYNYADWYIAWSIDDYVELTKSQEVVFEQSLNEVLTWHRKEQLPLYVDMLKRYRQALVNKDEQIIVDNYESSIQVLRTTVNHVAPKIIELGHMLSPEQKNELLENIKRKQQDDHEKWREKKQETSFEDKLEKSVEGSEELFGSVTEQQMEFHEQLQKQLVDTMEERIASRLTWFNLLSQALNVEQEGVEQQVLYTLLTDMESYRSESHLAKSEYNKQAYQEWLLQMLSSMTKKQQAHLLETIDDYIEDFEYLSQAE